MQTQRRRLRSNVKRLFRDESAATAIEYALIASVISIAILGSVAALGSSLVTNFYDKVAAALADAAAN